MSQRPKSEEDRFDLWLGIITTVVVILLIINVCIRFSPAPAAEVPRTSQGYDRMVSDLRIMHWEWERTTSDKRALIKDTITHLYPDYNPELLPWDLREFYTEVGHDPVRP